MTRVTRTFTASPGRLFRAFTDAVELAMWFGRPRYHVPEETVWVEPIVGGRWQVQLVGEADPSQLVVIDAELARFVESSLLQLVEPGGRTTTVTFEQAPAGCLLQVEVSEGDWPASLEELAMLVESEQ